MSTALIWGASGGMGRALVQRLHADEWTVGAVSRHPDDLANLTPHRYAADVADDFAVRQVVYTIAQELPEVDLWIYAAGDIALVELLAAQRSLHEAETAAARAHTNAAVQLVALYKALGGGWDVSTTASTATHPLRGAAAPLAFSSR